MEMEKIEPWKCLPCKRVCSGYHLFCGKCGQSWKVCADPNFVPPKRAQRSVQWTYNSTGSQWDDGTWTDAQWVQSPRRRQSPRQRSRKKSKGDHMDKGKGHAKGFEDKPSFGPPALPSMSAQPPWMVTSTPQQLTSPSLPSMGLQETREDREKDRQMRTLVAALRRHKDELPQDVQSVMKDINTRTGQDETKILHAAVSQHGRARKELEAAQMARLHLHSSWRNFLSKSVDQWKTYTAQFMEQEKAVSERVAAAQENLIAAKENLATCKSAAGADAREDTAMSDTEEAVTKVSDNSAGSKITESFKGLSTTLESLQSQAAQAVQQEEEQQDQLKKRQRTTPPDANTGEPVEAPAHFGGAE